MTTGKLANPANPRIDLPRGSVGWAADVKRFSKAEITNRCVLGKSHILIDKNLGTVVFAATQVFRTTNRSSQINCLYGVAKISAIKVLGVPSSESRRNSLIPFFVRCTALLTLQSRDLLPRSWWRAD